MTRAQLIIYFVVKQHVLNSQLTVPDIADICDPFSRGWVDGKPFVIEAKIADSSQGFARTARTERT